MKSIEFNLVFFNVTLFMLISSCGRGSGAKNSNGPDTQTSNSVLNTQDIGSCQLTSTKHWQDFLLRNASDSRWVDTCEDNICNASFHDFVAREVDKTFSTCSNLIDQNPGIKRCTDRFRRFAPTWLRQHDAVSYGFNRDNHAYLSAQTAAGQPVGMMDPPQVIVDAMPTRDKVEEAARLSGFKYLTHDSAIDNIRTFIYRPDPQGRYDQWMILNLATGPEDAASTLIFSVLVVEHHDAVGRKLERVKLHFRDYDVVERGGGQKSLQYSEDKTGKCYSCHVSGTRKLIDRETKTTAAKPVAGEKDFDAGGTLPAPEGFGRKRLDELNAILMSYGLPDWGNDVVPADHGPILGGKQGCTACHNGVTRGILTVSTSETQIIKKVAEQLSMPQVAGQIALKEKSEMRPSTMSAEDKAALAQAQDRHDQLTGQYLDSRLPLLQSWLMQERCE